MTNTSCCYHSRRTRGIGPDLVIQLAQRDWPLELVVCADATCSPTGLLLLGLPSRSSPNSRHSATPQRAGTLTLLPVALHAPVAGRASTMGATSLRRWHAPVMAV
ncbi:hypothetical protein ACNKHO_00420 [Shigella flexneri]